MEELAIIICSLGKAIDRAEVYGYPAEELRRAYAAAVKLKSRLMP